jgi:perosamine synthetase
VPWESGWENVREAPIEGRLATALFKMACSNEVRDFIPVNEPLLDGNEKKYLAECIDTGWISSEGPFVKRLEEGVAARTNRKYGIAVCNGSAALEVAVAALGLDPGDEVILPTFTIISCAGAIVRAAGIPVVVDSHPVTWNMDVSRLEELITPQTRAIMAVHIYGLPVDMDPLLNLAAKYGLKLIEDAAEAIGQTYKGRPCGSFGDISILSFYPSKHITTGEGGMLLTNDESLAERCRSLRNLCFDAKRFVHEEMGWNFRMSNVQAALGVAQLERLDQFVARKRALGALYQDRLQGVNQLELPVTSTDYAENIYWVFGVILKDDVPFDVSEVMRRLADSGVGTRPFFWPMHEQPVFQRMGLFRDVQCPVAERLARRGFYLPSGLALTPSDIEVVAKNVCQVLSICSGGL